MHSPETIAFRNEMARRPRLNHPKSCVLPLALGNRQFGLDHPDERTTGLIKRLRQFEDRGERRLLLAQFEDAHISASQVGLKAKFFLRQACLLAQLTENLSKCSRWLQLFLPLLEELGRKDMIVSSYSYGNDDQGT